MKLATIGEFGLINQFKAILNHTRHTSDVIAGIGDDAAVIKYTRDNYLLFTVDAIVENIHFLIPDVPFFGIGWKALACNISDIAAMGGIPKFALVSVGIPAHLPVENCCKIYQGIKKAAGRYQVSIVGGDTVASPQGLFISISLLGEVEKKSLVLRSGAKRKEAVLVTGDLGGSILKKHYSFLPRVEISRYLVRHFSVSAMIDISDGLAGDAVKIAQESKKGVTLWSDKIPISRAARQYSKKSKNKPLHHALYDGEDYELLFTADKNQVRAITEKIAKKFNVSVTEIGEITSLQKGYRLQTKEGEVSLHSSGFNHFL